MLGFISRTFERDRSQSPTLLNALLKEYDCTPCLPVRLLGDDVSGIPLNKLTTATGLLL
jgi:hypothetical protein